jgi:Calcineurin-like phosphoesterase/Fibronectin type III domain
MVGRISRTTRGARLLRGGVGALCAIVVLAGCMALAPPAGANAPYDPHLTRAPYLTDLVGLHVAVNWATDRSASTGSLSWGAVTGNTCTLSNTETPTRTSITVGTVLEYQWKASLTLPAQGTYCYRSLLGTTDLLAANSSPRFVTQVPSGDPTPFSFDVFGDWGQVDSSGNSADQTNLFSQVAASGARFAITVGDNGYPSGSQTNYGDLQQHGSNTSAIFGPTFWTVPSSTIPIFTAAGNHGLSGTTHTDITTWTQDVAVSSSGGRYQNDVYCCVNGSSSANYGSEWYAFDAGPARFYMLDSAWGDTNGGNASPYANDAAAHFAPGTPEYEWLLNDLRAHPTGLKFVFSHYPFYSDNNTQPSDTFLEGASNLEGLLAQYDVKMVFNGHAHIYERNTPSGPNMPVTYVTGGGGGTLEPMGHCHAYDAYAIGWSPSKSKGSACGAAPPPTSPTKVFHFLKVTVSGSTVTVTPTDENGNTFDVQTYNFPVRPNTLIDSAPATYTPATTATFTFHSTSSSATFACSLDGVTPAACTSPVSYAALNPGPHTFTVASTDSTGTDPSPATATWTIDTTAPTPPTQPAATAPAPNEVDVSWTAATDNVGVARYDILRDGVNVGSVDAPSTTFTDTSVAPSTTYQYSIDAVDGAGNTSSPSTSVPVTTPALGTVPSLVQSASSSSLTVTLPAPTLPGDLLVLSASVYTGTTKPITGITDGRNTWSKVGAYAVPGANSDGEMWFVANAASVSTVTVATNAPAVALTVQEFAGIGAAQPLDTSIGSAGSSKVATSGTATPTAANELAVGFVAGHSKDQAIGNLTAGYTTQPQQTTTTPDIVSVVAGYQALRSTGAQEFGGSFASSMHWAAGVALFKAVANTDFSIAASPDTVTVNAGDGSNTTITTAVSGGAAQNVTLTASGLPAGATASFSPATVTAGNSSTLTITTSTSTPVGTSTVTVTGTGTVATHSVPVTLTVNPPFNGPRLVQATGATESAAATSLTATFPTATTAGNLLVVSASVYTGATNHITSVTDSAGNQWTRIAAFDTSGHNSDGEMWYSASAAPVTNVTVHIGTAVSMAFGVQEFSGVATASPLDSFAGASNTSTGPAAGPVTPTGTNELVVGFVAGHANAETITVTSPGYTVQPQQTSTGPITSIVTGYLVAPTTDPQTFAAGIPTAMYWAAGIATFAAAP